MSDSTNRKRSLEILEEAIRLDAGSKATARKYAGAGESFESLASDEDFVRITQEPDRSEKSESQI